MSEKNIVRKQFNICSASPFPTKVLCTKTVNIKDMKVINFLSCMKDIEEFIQT